RLRGDLLGGERLELHELEPRRTRLQPLTATLPGRGLELQLERDPPGRDADLGEARDQAAHALPHRAARTLGPELVEARRAGRGEVDLANQDRGLRRIPPPV